LTFPFDHFFFFADFPLVGGAAFALAWNNEMYQQASPKKLHPDRKNGIQLNLANKFDRIFNNTLIEQCGCLLYGELCSPL
jgi:hypothetical protein